MKKSAEVTPRRTPQKADSFYHFKVEGAVVPKQRPRRNRTGQFYTPQKTKKCEQWVKVSFMSVYAPVRDSEHEWEVDLEINYKGRKPDIDNCAKSILDGLNNTLWVDDKQVRKLSCTMNHVDEKPCVYVKVWKYNKKGEVRCLVKPKEQ